MMDCSNGKKNEFKVDLENFQSISKASLDFVQGLNIIVGQSNSGKSAILRAIKGAILNPNGSQKYIKNGTEELKVKINYNGNEVEWSRKNKKTSSPKYKINGEEYLKVGNSNLPSILDNSGFVLDEGNSLMNIESELELPFPFDKNNSDLFKLFEKNIFCVSDSTSIVKFIKADEDEANRNKDNAEYELDRLKNKLQAVEELEAEVDIQKLINGRANLALTQNQISDLSDDIQELKNISITSKVLAKAIPIVAIHEVLQDYLLLLSDFNKLDEIRGVGKVLSTIPTASTPEIVDTNEYNDLRKDLKQLLQAQKLMSILRALEAPRTRGESEEYISLRNDLNALSRLREQAQNLHKQLEQNKGLMQELLEKKSQFKVCPLCGSELNEQ